MYNFELREITRFYSQIKAAVYEPTHDSKKYDFMFSDGKGRQLILMYIVPLLIGLKIVDISKYDNFINGRDIEPLKELLDIDEDNRLLGNMLNRDETFEKDDEKKLVTREEMIQRFYDAIFVKQYNGSNYNTVLGQYEFSKESWIRRIALDRLKVSFYMNELLRVSSVDIERGTSYPFARNFSFELQATF